jgi:hypothetical protein
MNLYVVYFSFLSKVIILRIKFIKFLFAFKNSLFNKVKISSNKFNFIIVIFTSAIFRCRILIKMRYFLIRIFLGNLLLLLNILKIIFLKLLLFLFIWRLFISRCCLSACFHEIMILKINYSFREMVVFIIIRFGI